jgi:hypothetical protein
MRSARYAETKTGNPSSTASRYSSLSDATMAMLSARAPFRWRLMRAQRALCRNQNGQPVEYGEPLFLIV